MQTVHIADNSSTSLSLHLPSKDNESLNCFCLGYTNHLHCLFQVSSMMLILEWTVVRYKAVNEYRDESCLIETNIAANLFIFLRPYCKAMHRFVTPFRLTPFVLEKGGTWEGPGPSGVTGFFQQFKRNKTKKKKKTNFLWIFLNV